MSITLDLPDELVARLTRLSAQTSMSVEELVTQGIQAQLSHAVEGTPDVDRAALEKLMRYAGCIDSGNPNSGDTPIDTQPSRLADFIGKAKGGFTSAAAADEFLAR